MNLFQNIQFFLLNIILLFSFVNCQNIPNPRYQQTSSLIGNRLYFFGGDLSPTDHNNDSATNVTNEVWYLDLSGSFNTATPPWNKDIGMPIGYNLGASCVRPIDNSVFLVGGRMYIPNTANINLGFSPVYLFNSNISLWTNPYIISFNSSFKMRNEIQPVIDNYGKIYTFGGTNGTDLNASNVDYNDMSILDTTSMTWSTLPISANTPPPYLSYTATLIPTGIIVYIGGYVSRSAIIYQYELVSMYEIQTFNTKNYTWSTKVASGATIGPRIGHSAVLTQYGDIIIYGGGAMLNDSTIPATPYVAKLDTSTWMWSIPNVSQINSPQLSDHSAALYGDYIIIAFGQIPSMSSISYSFLSNNLYILDIKNYTWITLFNPNQSTSNQTPTPNKSPTNQTPPPNKSPTNQPSPPNNNHLNNDLFIGIGIGAGIVLLGVFSVVGFLLYKRKKQNQFIPTPGTTDRNNMMN
ncbi:galactose oxidase [Gigaspora margarita]|uniref:Galactose oxidase n=1 Tax=Gigaspora margarita TaxID=4874 RepID=A0A8H4AZK8_GIGMA|nr:galactose oxidase [Gigaspora margarita]